MSWWDEPEHRNAASQVAAALLFAMVGALARLLKEWPRDTWVRQFGKWLTGVVAGGMAGLGLWELLLPMHPAPFLLAVLASAWLGSQLIDRLAWWAVGKFLRKDSADDR